MKVVFKVCAGFFCLFGFLTWPFLSMRLSWLLLCSRQHVLRNPSSTTCMHMKSPHPDLTPNLFKARYNCELSPSSKIQLYEINNIKLHSNANKNFRTHGIILVTGILGKAFSFRESPSTPGRWIMNGINFRSLQGAWVFINQDLITITCAALGGKSILQI